MNNNETVLIESMGNSGEGVGRIDGYTLFVKGALPGERVEVKVVERRRRYGRAELVSIVEKSEARVEPPCPYFGRCGGCQLMHLSYAKQLELKRQKVVDALQRIGKFENLKVEPCVPSPETLGYRNKIQLPVRKGPEIGLFEAESNALVDIDHCLIHAPLGDKVYYRIKKLLLASGVQGYDPASRQGELRHLLMKSSFAAEELLVALVTNGAPSKELKLLAARICDECPEVKGVFHNRNEREDNVILGENFTLMEGKAALEEQLCDLRFQVSPHSFFQVNPKQAEQLYRRALDAVKGEIEVVVDGYCGVGTLTLLFAKRAKKAIGIECVASAVADAKENAARNGIQNAEFLHGYAEKLLPKLKSADLLLLNPPRKGCDPQLIDSIAKLKPKQLLYISCDPATLARDLALIAPIGYAITLVAPFDMFPQTAHVETLVLCEKSESVRVCL